MGSVAGPREDAAESNSTGRQGRYLSKQRAAQAPGREDVEPPLPGNLMAGACASRLTRGEHQAPFRPTCRGTHHIPAQAVGWVSVFNLPSHLARYKLGNLLPRTQYSYPATPDSSSLHSHWTHRLQAVAAGRAPRGGKLLCSNVIAQVLLSWPGFLRPLTPSPRGLHLMPGLG